jgi:hypothetical protein
MKSDLILRFVDSSDRFVLGILKTMARNNSIVHVNTFSRHGFNGRVKSVKGHRDTGNHYDFDGDNMTVEFDLINDDLDPTGKVKSVKYLSISSLDIIAS